MPTRAASFYTPSEKYGLGLCFVACFLAAKKIGEPIGESLGGKVGLYLGGMIAAVAGGIVTLSLLWIIRVLRSKKDRSPTQ
jgi:hypothetical protein